MPTPSRPPLRFAVADHELTEDEIVVQYGGLLETAFVAFASDPAYATAMARNGYLLARRREKFAVYAERRANKRAANVTA